MPGGVSGGEAVARGEDVAGSDASGGEITSGKEEGDVATIPRPAWAANGMAAWLTRRADALRARVGWGGGAPRALAPALVVAVALVVMSWAYYVRWGLDQRVWGDDPRPRAVPVWLAYNDLGRFFAVHAGLQAEAIAPIGYDGQFYYYMARDPAVIGACARAEYGCALDASPLREERILYPMTARLVALGDPGAIHVALFAIDFVSIVLTALLVGRMCVEAGASRWLGVAAGLFCGELLALLHDLADPYGVLWAVLAVYLLRKNRPLWCGLAVGAALLTREQLVIALPLLALPWVVRREWRRALAFAVPALAPFLAWQAILRALFGQWGLTGSVTTTRGLRLPFLGLWEYRGGPEFGVTVAFVAVPLVCTAVVALLWLRRQGTRALLADPVPLVVLVYALFAMLTAKAEWEGPWSSARLIAPIVALGVVVACRIAPLPRYAYAALLCVTVLTPFLVPPVLF
jgi:hypothetical protein